MRKIKPDYLIKNKTFAINNWKNLLNYKNLKDKQLDIKRRIKNPALRLGLFK